MPKHKVLVTVPQPLRGLIVTDEAWAGLLSAADVVTNEEGRNWSGEELAARLPGVEAIIGSWGMPKLSEEVLAKADALRLIAYAAGSVKGFVTDAVHRRGIAVSHAAARIADSVAEYSLLCALIGLRRPHEFDRKLKAGEPWPKSRDMDLFEIAGKKVGLLGMGYVGQRSARLFRAVGAEVWAYDPYLSSEDVARLGVKKVDLDALLRGCKVISVHLPVTQETHHLLGARELALVQDGAVFINSARSWVVDQEALLKELSRGRFWAALDVFDQEPLPVDHPLRRLDNVLLTPHVAGLTRDAYQDLMSDMIAEVLRFFRGEPLLYKIDPEKLEIMA
ncbi:MAG: hydroxyacid dehydrogenase [Chloroflexi bacterium]|nr:hydroxyacid dehydrogenase [Chloroflexota bacterium]